MSHVNDILRLAHLRSTKIAEILGCNARYVRRVLAAHGKNHPVGPPPGEDNPSWVGGRMLDLGGYVLLQTKPTRILEHRKVMESVIGRPLASGEVVDHIDGITIHNDPENLRLFSSNGAHLAATITGRSKLFSVSGRVNIGARTDLGAEIQRVDIYLRRKERGDVRLHAILRAALQLGTEHPCLSGLLHWFEQSEIDPWNRRSLELAWTNLQSRFEQDLCL